MNLIISCMKCFEESGKPSEEFSRVELRDDGRYELTCSNNHTTITILQQQKFEILFEIGAHAILDGYYREAVSSFTSSLERFYEFCIKVILETRGISDELFKKGWKEIANQSERQLGAFIFLWIYCFNECPSILSSKWAGFRNEVIHKGRIPTKQEAIDYGNIVLDIVRPQMRSLQSKYSEEVSKVVFKHLRNCRNEADKGKLVATMCSSTIVRLSCGGDDFHSKSLEELLEHLKKKIQVMGGI